MFPLIGTLTRSISLKNGDNLKRLSSRQFRLLLQSAAKWHGRNPIDRRALLAEDGAEQLPLIAAKAAHNGERPAVYSALLVIDVYVASESFSAGVWI